MRRRVLVGRGPLAVLLKVPLVFVIALGVFLASCGGEEEGSSEASNVPSSQPAEEVAGNVVVRVSGTQGTPYLGTFGTYQETQNVDGTLEAEPTDYQVEVGSGVFGVVIAEFSKPQPGGGTLRVEILEEDGTVTVENETSDEFGVINLTRYPA